MARPASQGQFFTPEEVDAVLPGIRERLRQVDGLLARQRELRELVEDLEAYWGEAVLRPDNRDYTTYEGLQEELEGVLRSIEDQARQIHALGGHVKSFEGGLVDFYGRREGRTVFLCWRRGEPSVAYYHELEAGYSGRKPLDAETNTG